MRVKGHEKDRQMVYVIKNPYSNNSLPYASLAIVLSSVAEDDIMYMAAIPGSWSSVAIWGRLQRILEPTPICQGEYPAYYLASDESERQWAKCPRVSGSCKVITYYPTVALGNLYPCEQ